MIPEFDKNAAFIWASYALGAVMIGGAILTVMIKARLAQAELARTQARTEEARRK
ncbi:heme exporter protein CcmD [Hyphomonas pacifica]|uniref:Heme exporter protein D n=1 Tax=Hyphomonas pacifica TaxID=1280941 RepID=A0A062TN90_9PROT|nr:heme exporter protein CcmD [Hyphomonas pacifica]KCZ46224.1 hypothetical protein HY2_05960 [Hyphomonas pacifica]RAN31499.1 hypothetical protein HY11_06955 [Hyphomonas pacifica]RAN35826.1 hypothetical protein HY3_06935 [Hyphomonas pacifica]